MLRMRAEPAVLPLLPEAAAAGGFRFRLFCLSSCFRRCCSQCAAYAAGIAGSSAMMATAAVSAASNSSGSSSFGSLSSIDADGAVRLPVRGLTQQPCAASTSWSQSAAACATDSGRRAPAAAPATSTDISDGSGCRFPRALRASVSSPSSNSRRDTGSGAVPAGRWRRTQRQAMMKTRARSSLVTDLWRGNLNHHHEPRPPQPDPHHTSPHVTQATHQSGYTT